MQFQIEDAPACISFQFISEKWYKRTDILLKLAVPDSHIICLGFEKSTAPVRFLPLEHFSHESSAQACRENVFVGNRWRLHVVVKRQILSVLTNARFPRWSSQ